MFLLLPQDEMASKHIMKNDMLSSNFTMQIYKKRFIGARKHTSESSTFSTT